MLDWSKIDPSDRTTPIRVVFYGRVSTEHEMQLDAFENQTQWYYDQLEQHKNWVLVKPIETYLDRGITGTQAKKRPGFLAMIKDAEHDLFDMIVTRENSRFARNTEESLKYVRILRERDIQVYFVSDGIRTIQDTDASLKLGLMATFAEQESRKISDRVKAGQCISRQNGVLYGSGNVLGYNRVRKVHDNDKKGRIGDKSVPTFEIDPAQAETVRMIFDLFEQGLGLKKIKTVLLQKKRKNATGGNTWHESNISKILANPIYIGKQYQNQTKVKDFRTGKHIAMPKEEWVIIEGDFEPIISEEQFYRVQKIKADKLKEDPNSKFGKRGYKTSDKWVEKLECACGSGFRKYTGRVKKDGSVPIRYDCRNRSVNGSLEKRIKDGLFPDIEGIEAIQNMDEAQIEELINAMNNIDVTDEEGNPVILPNPIEDICSIKGIPEWHFEIMAKKVFTYITSVHRDRILRAYDVIAENYVSELEATNVDISKLKKEISKLDDKLERLHEIYIDGDISKEQYQEKHKALMEDKNELKQQLYQAENPEGAITLEKRRTDDLNEVLDTMINMFDFSHGIDPMFLKHYVDKIVVRSDHCYEWMINLRGDSKQFVENNHMIAAAKKSEKRRFTKTLQETKYDTMFTDTVNFDEAREYRKSNGVYLRYNQWVDLLITVYVRN